MRKVKLFGAIALMIVMLAGAVLSIIYLTKKDVRAKVVTTIFPIYDICREIMGDDDELLLLEDNGVDMHSYNPTPSDIATIAQAELMIYIGGESDEKVVQAISSAANVNLDILALMEVEEMMLLSETDDNIINNDHNHEHEHEEHEDEHDEHNGEHDEVYDEHIWLSIRNAIVITEAIRDALIEAFPGKQEIYKVNAEAYIAKLKALDNDYQAIADKTDTVIIADRFPFRYLMHDYNINYYALFSGCSTESQASAENIAAIIEKINAVETDCIFVLETSDQKIANSIKDNKSVQKDLKIHVINSCQSISQSTMHSTSYLQIMTQNLEVLKKAIKI